MWSQILDEFSNHFILLGVAICVTLVAIWAGQSRLHWFWRGCVLAAVLALFLPVRAHEPLLFFLIAAPVISVGVAWMESRRERGPTAGAIAGADVKSTKSRQLSLTEAFLLLGLVGMACGLGSAAFRNGLMMDWRSLPVSALALASVAMLSYYVAAFSKGIPHHWALAISIVMGAGLFAWFALKGRNFSPIANASPAAACAWWGAMVLACLVVFVVWYCELRFGSPRHFVALIGVVFLAPRIELDALGDWMFVGDFLHWYQPGARPFGLFFLTIAYGLFAAATVVSVALGRLAFSTKAAAWQKHLSRAAGICAAGYLLYSLGGIYWRMAVTLAPPVVPTAQRGEYPLEKALPLLDEFFALEYPGGFVFVPGEIPKALARHQPNDSMTAVYARLVDQLQKPGWAPLGSPRETSFDARKSQELILYKLLAFGSILDADARQAIQRKDFDAALPYVMAQVQLENSLQHGGLIMHRNFGTNGLTQLAELRNDISTANARQVLTALRRFEREREPLDVTLRREQAWEERELNWRSRLRRLRNQDVPILDSAAGNGFSSRGLYPLKKIRELEQFRPTPHRVLAAEFAVRLFRDDHSRLPRDLEELVPKYLDAVPLDPFSPSDQPLVYRVEGDKYRLYTVYANGLDDGGKTGKGNNVEYMEKLPVDYDVDTGVRALANAWVEFHAKAAQDARVKASMLKAQKGGGATTAAPTGTK